MTVKCYVVLKDTLHLQDTTEMKSLTQGADLGRLVLEVLESMQHCSVYMMAYCL